LEVSVQPFNLHYIHVRCWVCILTKQCIINTKYEGSLVKIGSLVKPELAGYQLYSTPTHQTIEGIATVSLLTTKSCSFG